MRFDHVCRQIAAVLVLAASIPAGGLEASTLVYETVTVGDAGNAADSTGYGAVSYEYRIGKYEWTNDLYAEFLYAVDPDGLNPHGILEYGGMTGYPRGGVSVSGTTPGHYYGVQANMGNKPVQTVSWFNAARVANWLHHGAQRYGTTASGSAAMTNGAYDLSNAANGIAPAKHAGARYWVPTENEWYKAAYYKGGGTNSGYWTFATQSSSVPGSVNATATGDATLGGVSPVTGNHANYYNSAIWNGDINFTTVGTNGGASFYGTSDMTGNVREWNDLDGQAGSTRGVRDGSINFTDPWYTSSQWRDVFNPSWVLGSVGFRLAAAPVPEIDPAGAASVAGLVTGALGLLERRRTRA